MTNSSILEPLRLLRMNVKDSKMLALIAQSIFDKKGINILVLDARHMSTLADYFVIAEGRSDRHLRAVTDSVEAAMSVEGRQALAVEGKKFGEWIAIDYGDVIVHLFAPNIREKYSLEELWRECQIVDVPLHVRTEAEGKKDIWEGYE